MAVLFRFISLILIVVALMLLGADIVSSLEKNEITVRTIEQVWALLGKGGLAVFKAWVQVALPGPLRNWVYSVLNMWAFGVSGVLGVILAFLFGRRHVVD
ncbi:MAG: hypothetical protein KGR48_15745 [Alphaproteobacteria bacterium]|nr:hypothetical protein [Alphaproteobacteria bacterium]